MFAFLCPQGCRNGRFVKRSFCPLPKTGGFDENRRNSDSAFYPQKQGFCSSGPEIDENDENGGCHPSKMTVCQKHRFNNLDCPSSSFRQICAKKFGTPERVYPPVSQAKKPSKGRSPWACNPRPLFCQLHLGFFLGFWHPKIAQKYPKLPRMPEILGQKSCRTKVPRIFRIFVPNFAPGFAPNFPRIFEEFSWETETRKNSPKSPGIFQCKIPRQVRRKNPQKFFEGTKQIA